MVLKLHGLSVSTCTARVVACLHEKSVDFELVPVDLFACENKQPEFLAKNPFGLVPVLEDDGITLFESRAIAAYVAEKFKETGHDLVRRENFNEAALVKVWTEVESQQYNPAIEPIIFEFFAKPVVGIEPDQTVIDASLEKLKKVLDVYEARLRSNKFLAGDFYSLADLHHFPGTFYFMKTPWSSLVDDRPRVKAWWEEISARPASKKVAEETRAIRQYIAHEYADKGTPLVIRDSKKMAILSLWTEVEGQKFDPASSKLTYELAIKPLLKMTTDAAVVEEYAPKLAVVLDVYETCLAQSKYLAGKSFTLADLQHLPTIHYLMGTQSKKMFESRPHVSAWVGYITAHNLISTDFN
ncbi:hypothetical protein ACFX11_008211 [Malus domestica]